jgi:hypothetical protein
MRVFGVGCSSPASAEGPVSLAATEPLHSQRVPGICDRRGADFFSDSVVDFGIALLVDLQHHHQSSARFNQAAHRSRPPVTGSSSLSIPLGVPARLATVERRRRGPFPWRLLLP